MQEAQRYSQEGQKLMQSLVQVNRQDAEDRLRALRRYVPNATFEIVFDLVES